ncbi:hypothetical protein [Leptospira adleri]|uniref:Lipoprotein n=1 Tax=Leptospira adleri TaxID=2023186 RepID=A0A2M9YI38_9LEPT|nr:hypothetical protein [Leptospira adleri]PJZ51209.1 hypothetical protein CH380_21305 [Leptospira adleri]PJZ59412.1 hypothetical protein CH376_23845 [Leptospira adleri]
MKEIYNILIYRKLLILTAIIFCSCQGSIVYWQHLTYKVKDSKKSYIRFELPSKYEEGGEMIKVDKYFIKILLLEKDSVFKRYVLINPNRRLSFLEEWYGLEQFVFYPNCEYKVEVPIGENKFKIEIAKFESTNNGFYSILEKSVEIPQNYSLRLILTVAGLAYKDPINWTQKFNNRLNSRIEIVATVEPNPDPDEDKICEIPKD